MKWLLYIIDRNDSNICDNSRRNKLPVANPFRPVHSSLLLYDDNNNINVDIFMIVIMILVIIFMVIIKMLHEEDEIEGYYSPPLQQYLIVVCN